jgi:hypothetical protein
VERQAIDRSHRIGQTKPVEVLHLISHKSIEQRIYDIQKEKAALAKGALTGNFAAAQLTISDLRRLFHLDPDGNPELAAAGADPFALPPPTHPPLHSPPLNPDHSTPSAIPATPSLAAPFHQQQLDPSLIGHVTNDPFVARHSDLSRIFHL